MQCLSFFSLKASTWATRCQQVQTKMVDYSSLMSLVYWRSLGRSSHQISSMDASRTPPTGLPCPTSQPKCSLDTSFINANSITYHYIVHIKKHGYTYGPAVLAQYKSVVHFNIINTQITSRNVQYIFTLVLKNMLTLFSHVFNC